ncbi:MAG: class I SAM-dependent methyltransferase, partial [Armatimonadota bacterium]
MYASRIGNEAVGVDINDEDIRKAEVRARLLGLSDVEFVRGDLQNLAEVTDALGQFDQVICMEVIEHIEDDRRVVADLASLLRPGGRLLITTPSQDR